MTWPPSTYAISILIGLVLLIITIAREGIGKFQEGDVHEPVINAFVPGFLIGNLFFPVMWTSFSMILRSGTPLEENLYPGTTALNFMFWAFVVSLIITWESVARFIGSLARTPRDE